MPRTGDLQERAFWPNSSQGENVGDPPFGILIGKRMGSLRFNRDNTRDGQFETLHFWWCSSTQLHIERAVPGRRNCRGCSAARSRVGSSLVMRWNTPGNKFETALPLTMVEQHLFQDDPALWAAATFYVGGDSKIAAALSRDLRPPAEPLAAR
jgi:hypothetical protein